MYWERQRVSEQRVVALVWLRRRAKRGGVVEGYVRDRQILNSSINGGSGARVVSAV